MFGNAVQIAAWFIAAVFVIAVMASVGAAVAKRERGESADSVDGPVYGDGI